MSDSTNVEVKNVNVDDTTGLPGDKPAKEKKERKPRPPKKEKEVKPEAPPVPSASQKAREAKEKAAVLASKWATRYTGTTVLVSSALNAYSAVVESGQTTMVGSVAAGSIGALVPVLVWMLGCVTAWTWKSGWHRLAYVTGAISCCVLALSVIHVASALASLTGTGLVLSGLLAVGIDCGLVASEATAVLVSTQE